jgi:hypothetical protein
MVRKILDDVGLDNCNVAIHARNGSGPKDTQKNVRIAVAAVGDIVFGRAGEKFGLDDPFRHVAHLWKGGTLCMAIWKRPFRKSSTATSASPKTACRRHAPMRKKDTAAFTA